VSATERPDVLLKQFEADEAEGMRVGVPPSVAASTYGSKLAVASQGALLKSLDKDEHRVIHDGTFKVLVNHSIRVRDQLRTPSFNEARCALHEMSRDGLAHFALPVDMSKAHRRTHMREQDWGYQACQVSLVPDTVFLNKVGTFGISSASYWWSRLLACIIRAQHYCLSKRFMTWILTYVDDIWMTAGGPHSFTALSLSLLFYALLGVPFAWHKVKGGAQLDWVGYWIDVERFRVGGSLRRQQWIVKWLADKLESPEVVVRDVVEGPGRLSFAAGPLVHLRPFLGPIHAYVSAAHPQHYGRLPLIVRLVFILLSAAAKLNRFVECRPLRQDLGELFRLDAKAEGDLVVVGGWETGLSPDPAKARWFSLQLTRKNAGWAFSKGEAFRTIASLELFAFLVGIMLFVRPSQLSDYDARIGMTGVRFTAFTDNQSNQYLIDKLQTTRMPLCAVLMKVAWQLSLRNVSASLLWIP
jgi:hypothetical protein